MYQFQLADDRKYFKPRGGKHLQKDTRNKRKGRKNGNTSLSVKLSYDWCTSCDWLKPAHSVASEWNLLVMLLICGTKYSLFLLITCVCFNSLNFGFTQLRLTIAHFFLISVYLSGVTIAKQGRSSQKQWQMYDSPCY